MRPQVFIILGFLFLLSSCTSLNDRCGYIPPGDCWDDSNACNCKLSDQRGNRTIPGLPYGSRDADTGCTGNCWCHKLSGS